MKQIQQLIAILTTLSILFSSCSKLIYSHQEFMETLKTKNDVTAHFGMANEYQELTDTTKWLYNLDDQRKLTSRNPDPVSLKRQSGPPKKVDAFLYPEKFLDISFKEDSVINYASRNVNFTLRKKQPLKTVLLVAGILGIGIAVMAATYKPFTKSPVVF